MQIFTIGRIGPAALSLLAIQVVNKYFGSMVFAQSGLSAQKRVDAFRSLPRRIVPQLAPRSRHDLVWRRASPFLKKTFLSEFSQLFRNPAQQLATVSQLVSYYMFRTCNGVHVIRVNA